jgi:cytochrome bd-type quinol oxidase subunit 2
MMRSKKQILLLIALVIGGVFLMNTPGVSALTLREGVEAARCDGCPADLFGDGGVFKQITNTLIYIVGVIAVVMLVFGGIKYVVSGGDAKKVTDAKNTVLYAIIGLVIAFVSYAIVTFVISALPSSDNPNTTSLVLSSTKC